MGTSHCIAGLVDDAGLFPPTELSMPDAIARHREDEANGSVVHTDRMLVAASRVGELLDALDDRPLDVGLVVDVPLDQARDVVQRLHDDPRTELGAVEIRLAAGGDDPQAAVRAITDTFAALPPRVAVYVEVPLDDHLDDTLAALGDARLGAKVRCGGVKAEMFPSTDQLVRFLQGVVREGLPFKATAGLHHAVRYTDEQTGFAHHGFLNLLVGTQRAVECRPAAEIAEVLTSTDGEQLARDITAADELVDDQVREHFVAYGSCDTRAPLADLQAVGLA